MKKLIIISAILATIGGYWGFNQKTTSTQNSDLEPLVSESLSEVVKSSTVGDVVPQKNVASPSHEKVALSPVVAKGEHAPEFVRELFAKQTSAKAIYKKQKTFVFDLATDLTEDERDALYYFLIHADNERYTLHVKDEVLIKLEGQKQWPPEYIDTLISFINDTTIGGDLRGYLMQHLRSAYSRDDVDKMQIRTAMYDGLEDLDSDVSGTAALAVVNLQIEFPDHFDSQLIEQAVVALAADESLHIPSRITAVQLCGKINLVETADCIRNIMNTAEDMTLRLAAVSSLGQIGSEYDIEVLETILENESKLYHLAAQNSINTISERLGLTIQ